MSNLYRRSSIDASYQVSVHLAKRFQRRRFLKNWPIRNKNCLWQPCLLMDRDKMSNIYKGPFIDASYQVSEEKIKMWKVNGRRTTDGKSSHCLWQGELKRGNLLFSIWIQIGPSWTHYFQRKSTDHRKTIIACINWHWFQRLKYNYLMMYAKW
jgi:hypothetical protein